MPIHDGPCFALLVHIVAALMRLRARGQHWPQLDATLADLIHVQGRLLHHLGGRPMLDRAVVHVDRHVGRCAAVAVMEIFDGFGN